MYKKITKSNYSSIQVTLKFKEELKSVKDENHFDSYESTIKYLISKRR